LNVRLGVVNTNNQVSAVAYGGWENRVAKPEVAYAAFGNVIWYRETIAACFQNAVTQPPSAKTISGIFMDPTTSKSAYAVDDADVYAPNDGGRNWADMPPQTGTNGGLPVDGLNSVNLVKVQEAVSSDLRIEFRDGTSFDVSLAGVNNVGQLKTAIDG